MADDTNKPADATPSTETKPVPAPAKPAASRRTPRTAKPASAKPAATRNRRAAATKSTASAAAKPAVRKPASKPAPAKRAAPSAKPAAAQKAAKPAKPRKVKLVRDSFTMPETEYALIAELKKRCLGAGIPAKKSEILRAAVAGLAKLSDASVAAAIRRLDVIKTGRPAKSAK